MMSHIPAAEFTVLSEASRDLPLDPASPEGRNLLKDANSLTSPTLAAMALRSLQTRFALFRRLSGPDTAA